MHVSALKQKVEEVVAVDVLAWDGPLATFHTAWTINPRHISRAEIAGLVLLSIVLHSLVAARLARPGKGEPVAHEQRVSIEFLRPPPAAKPLPPPPAPTPEKPAPVVRRAAVEPHAARPEPAARSTPVSPPHEAPALPEGDDPALAGPSSTGTLGTTPVPVAAPAPVAAPPPPAPVRVVAAHEGANYLRNPRPAYPEIALRRSWEGEVLLRVHVSPEGRPAQIAIAKSSGRDVLDEAAVEAVRGWSFMPARLGAQAVGGWVTVPIVFHLQ